MRYRGIRKICNRRAPAKDSRAICAAGTIEEAGMTLAEFSRRWDEKYPAVSRTQNHFEPQLHSFFDMMRISERLLLPGVLPFQPYIQNA